MSSAVSLEAGLEALRQERYSEAIDLLNAYCQTAKPTSRDYWQAKMHLVKTYRQQGELQQAIDLCQQLLDHSNAQIQIWAQQELWRIEQQQTGARRSIFSRFGAWIQNWLQPTRAADSD